LLKSKKKCNFTGSQAILIILDAFKRQKNFWLRGYHGFPSTGPEPETLETPETFLCFWKCFSKIIQKFFTKLYSFWRETSHDHDAARISRFGPFPVKLWTIQLKKIQKKNYNKDSLTKSVFFQFFFIKTVVTSPEINQIDIFDQHLEETNKC
jgi:hypothetical protein